MLRYTGHVRAPQQSEEWALLRPSPQIDRTVGLMKIF